MVVNLGLIILIGSAVLAVMIGLINAYGKKHHIGEARFDGETGKQIEDKEDRR